VPGPTELFVGTASPLPLSIPTAGDVYDLALAYDGATAAAFPNFPIR
jgi:hypothetical protein